MRRKFRMVGDEEIAAAKRCRDFLTAPWIDTESIPDAAIVDLLALSLAAVKDRTPRPLDDYHEDEGNVLWWRFPIDEPPYVGSPLCSDWIESYYTHWVPLPIPMEPETKSNTDGKV